VCGICGILTGSPALADEARVRRMTEVIHHRGPDDVGVKIDHRPSVSAALGHRRLSIIDLSSAGHQPMTNEDGSLWLVYNGEIYNHLDVRQDLEAAGHVYRSHSDSETILHAYEQWGEACVERFRGMFAFALWDGPRQRAFFARDRLGVKPLYYALAGDTLVFGSEIKAILESSLVPVRVAEPVLPEYLMFGYLAGEDTLFEGVRKLMPGHTMTWDARGLVTRRYWNVTFRPDPRLTETDAVERLRELIEESVRIRLMSDVPLGVFLSGGLDSSAIAAVMARQVPERLKTFSVGFESQYYSELPFARQVADHLGSDHHEVLLTPDAFIESLPRMVWHEDEPSWAAPSVALYHVAALARQQVIVVLTGEGSDEMFGGYDRYWMGHLNDRVARHYCRLPAGMRGLVRRSVIDGVLPERLRRALSHTPLNHAPSADAMVFDNWFGVFTPAMQRRLGTSTLARALDAADVYANHRQWFDEQPGAELVDRMLYTDVKTNLVELLMKQDQMSMAASVESRVPFLDHELVEFGATIPWRFKLQGRSGKHPIKKALAGYLPHGILHRPKKGFPVPFDSWLRERFLPHVAALVTGERARGRGWFDPTVVSTLVEAHRAGRQNAARQIWNLFGLELWARIFLDGERGWLTAPAEQWTDVLRDRGRRS
jgi:asparagine synthase (glutamine-hydrolysing)